MVDFILPVHPDPDGLLSRAIFRVRWAVLAMVFLLTLARPLPTRIAFPMWAAVLLFAGYHLLVDLVRRRVPWLRSYAHVALLDLPVTVLIYSFGVEMSGPLFVLLVLAIFSAAVSMEQRGALIYTGAVAMLVLAIAPTFPHWSPNVQGIRELTARLLVLGTVGVSATIIVRRLEQEHEAAQLDRHNAQRLAEMDRLRADFVSTVSHDLRTPLTAARAGLGMLESSAIERLRLDEQQLLSNARRNVERLAVLIDDLIVYNQFESGQVRLERRPLDLRTVVADAISVVHPLMEQKGQTLELDLPEPLPYEGDASRLEQMIVNILHNAYRYSPGGASLLVRGRLSDGDIRLSIRDNGPGIPPDELEAIFQRFYRLDASQPGSGLGLAIAKRIVELHGGRVWAESEPGKGAVFHITLPRSGGAE